MSLIIRSPVTATGSLGNYKDPLIPSAGLKFVFDLASPLSWASQAAPTNGLNVADYANGANGSVLVPTGQTVAYAGNGFDFSGVTLDGEIITAPAGVLADIFAQQYFLVAFYAKLPASSDWDAVSTLAAMFCSTTQETGYLVEEDMLLIAMKTGNLMTFRRETVIGTVATLELDASLHNGKVTQVAFWRNAAGTGARLCSTGGITIATGAVGSKNTSDFSAKIPRFGICESFNKLDSYPSHITAAKWRLYRGFIENLNTSGRDPLTVLDADYARMVKRAVFS